MTNKDNKDLLLICCINCWVLYNRSLVFAMVLESLGRSGRLVGSFSTYPGTSKCPWSWVIAKNPGGICYCLRYFLARIWICLICGRGKWRIRIGNSKKALSFLLNKVVSKKKSGIEEGKPWIVPYSVKKVPPRRVFGYKSWPRALIGTRIREWILSASRTFLNPPGPWGNAKNLLYRTRKVTEKISKSTLCSLLITFKSRAVFCCFYCLPYDEKSYQLIDRHLLFITPAVDRPPPKNKKPWELLRKSNGRRL